MSSITPGTHKMVELTSEVERRKGQQPWKNSQIGCGRKRGSGGRRQRGKRMRRTNTVRYHGRSAPYFKKDS